MTETTESTENVLNDNKMRKKQNRNTEHSFPVLYTNSDNKKIKQVKQTAETI